MQYAKGIRSISLVLLLLGGLLLPAQANAITRSTAIKTGIGLSATVATAMILKYFFIRTAPKVDRVAQAKNIPAKAWYFLIDRILGWPRQEEDVVPTDNGKDLVVQEEQEPGGALGHFVDHIITVWPESLDFPSAVLESLKKLGSQINAGVELFDGEALFDIG